jgi:hypothetical protein
MADWREQRSERGGSAASATWRDASERIETSTANVASETCVLGCTKGLVVVLTTVSGQGAVRGWAALRAIRVKPGGVGTGGQSNATRPKGLWTGDMTNVRAVLVFRARFAR